MVKKHKRVIFCCFVLSLAALTLIILYGRSQFSAFKARTQPWLTYQGELKQIDFAIRMYKEDYNSFAPAHLRLLTEGNYLDAPFIDDYTIRIGKEGQYIVYRLDPLPSLKRRDWQGVVGIDDVSKVMRNVPEITPPHRPFMTPDGSMKNVREDMFKSEISNLGIIEN